MPRPPFRFRLRLALALCLLALFGASGATLPAAAQEVPDELRKVIAASKLHYEIGAPGPVQKPVEGLRCPARGTDLKVVRMADGSKQLQPWKPSTAAAPHFAEAEKQFAAQDYAAAGEEYKKGLALDPDYGPGWLYAGDIPFAQKDFPAALSAYKKALALDPTLAQAHRFAADVLLKTGKAQEAADEYVKALLYDPSYDGALEGLEVLGVGAGFTVARHEFLPPQGVLGEAEGGKVPIALDAQQKEWIPYFACKAVWRNEAAYRQRRLGTSGPYNWTLNEETECLVSYLAGNLDAAVARLKAAAARQGHAAAPAPPSDIPVEQAVTLLPPLARHLKEVADAGLLSGYALYAVVGRSCPVAISLLPGKAQEDLERYIRRFVIVPTPSGPAGNTAKPAAGTGG
jgi:tetratricopeptide (TPR) repeat protein